MTYIRQSSMLRQHRGWWLVTAAAALLPACSNVDAERMDDAGASAAPELDAAMSAEPLPLDGAAPDGARLIAGPGADAEPTLAEVRAATARYQDVDVALADGYVRDPFDLCDTAEMMGRPAEEGVMGIHFARPDLLGITGPPNPRVSGTGTHTDFRQPSILIYEPQADGTLELVAVENLVFVKSWEAAGMQRRPSFQGREFDLMADDPATTVDEAHMFEPHYDLHVWLYRENPRGMFAQFNPNATCTHHKGNTHAH